jgi:UPF0755 protein
MVIVKIMNKKTVQIFLLIFDVILIIIYSLIFYLSEPIYSTKVVNVPKGSISAIISYLEKQKFNVSLSVDKYLLYLIGKPQFGWIEIGKNKLSRGDFLYKLSHEKAALQPIKLIPGETIDVFMYELSKKYGLNYKKLMKYYNELSPLKDGFIVPETYHIPIGIGEKHLIVYLLNYAYRYQKEMSIKIFKTYNQKSWFRYLIIASIIQKEAASVEEMPIVSSVIYNRLKKGMKLQMDGTLNYGKFSHIRVSAKRIKEDNSLFNTYKHIGLPPYPVCSVSKEAIFAAIFPKKTNYLYFVKSKNGKHVFSSTYKMHMKNIKKN